MNDRDFARVAELYAKAIPTFSAFSVFSLNDLVKYATILGIMYLNRPDLKSYLVEQSDVEIALMDMPVLHTLIHSFHDCKYNQFFLCLLDLEGILKEDPYLHKSVSLIIEKMRLKAYQQYLDSFKSYTFMQRRYSNE